MAEVDWNAIFEDVHAAASEVGSHVVEAFLGGDVISVREQEQALAEIEAAAAKVAEEQGLSENDAKFLRKAAGSALRKQARAARAAAARSGRKGSAAPTSAPASTEKKSSTGLLVLGGLALLGIGAAVMSNRSDEAPKGA